MTDAADWELRSFTPSSPSSDARLAAWLEATALGYHEVPPTPEHVRRTAEVYAADERTLTGAYAASSPSGAWPADRPVATYAAFDKTLNVGNGELVRAHLIGGVTVRSTYRRRGIMRAMLETDLRRAAGDGIPIAALFSMEATIYGRFGFGAATFTNRVEVDTGEGFALNSAPTGRVEVADAVALAGISPTVFARFHTQTLGSIERAASYPSKIAGLWAEDRPDADPTVRAALHYDGDEIDGYVAYRFLGWTDQPRTLEIVDIVALSANAYLGLWQYLASIDLVTRVRLEHASPGDPLPWALRDRRGFSVTGQEDGLWLRILDPVSALRARSYETDGELTFSVTDPLDICRGVYRLAARNGTAEIEKLNEDADAPLAMDISALGSLYLGCVRAGTLAEAGRITVKSAPALDTLEELMAQRTDPFCASHF
jgi:predicted acetyltransferase